jgi:hypothetical protein
MIDRRHQTRAQEVRFLRRHRISAPKPQDHRREGIATDRFVEGDATDKDAFVRGYGYGRRPWLGSMCPPGR